MLYRDIRPTYSGYSVFIHNENFIQSKHRIEKAAIGTNEVNCTQRSASNNISHYVIRHLISVSLLKSSRSVGWKLFILIAPLYLMKILRIEQLQRIRIARAKKISEK